jgi:hypothetical protein
MGVRLAVVVLQLQDVVDVVVLVQDVGFPLGLVIHLALLGRIRLERNRLASVLGGRCLQDVSQHTVQLRVLCSTRGMVLLHRN